MFGFDPDIQSNLAPGIALDPGQIQDLFDLDQDSRRLNENLAIIIPNIIRIIKCSRSRTGTCVISCTQCNRRQCDEGAHDG